MDKLQEANELIKEMAEIIQLFYDGEIDEDDGDQVEAVLIAAKQYLKDAE